jgi:2-dehydropantoate 2-reductase
LRIAIIGAGAIGCLFGILLHQSGQSVLLVHHRKGAVAYIDKKGLTLRRLSGKPVRARVKVKQSLSERDSPDLVILTVKAYDTKTATQQLETVLSGGVPILSIQNGFGNIETISRFLPKHVAIGGTTTEGALLRKPGDVVHTGRGTTWIGEIDGRLTGRLHAIKSVLRDAGFRTEVSKNIRGVIWSKAIVNSAINPITAIARVSNGELLTNSYLLDAAFRLLDEGVAVANTRQVSLALSPFPLLIRALTSTRNNKSSMLRDMESGRTTEIRQLNGWIVARGEDFGVDTPYNSLVTQLVLGLEEGQNRLSRKFRPTQNRSEEATLV